ncbi:Ig-like domain repeat protein [Tumebacillus sp. DT12]|uniref:Ig-like domain repeat protein n=1 Tax=Tumebacillus lacus TaxID=2995335 RepID=A0ABT3WXR2_9BACL|nr:Ig-like domain repeat protein [Tumebacillus lacus]MCX7569465.1 Ig-like domain repeat protein [Tumebacillus lacus]
MVKSSKLVSLLLMFLMVLQLVSPAFTAQAATPGPTNLTYKFNTPSDISLSWTALTGATEYRVYELTSGTPVQLAKASSNVRNLTGLTPGQHVYAVSAIMSGVETDLSNQVAVDVVYPTMQPPASLTHTVSNVNDVTLRWTASANAQSYNVFQVVDGKIKLLGNTVSITYFVSNVPQTATFYVTSVNSMYGESAQSAPLNVSLSFPDMQPPTGLTHTVSNGNDVVLKWNSATYANSYNIYKVVDGKRQFFTNYSSTARSMPNHPEGTFTYEVTSVSDRFGESKTSSTLTFTLVYPTMQPPANFKSSFSNGNDLNLSWSTATNAVSYNLYQIENGQRKLIANVVSPNRAITNMPEGNFKFEVTSYNSRFGESQPSVLDVAVVYPKMQAPANGKYFVSNGNDMTLRWDAALYANSYNIYKLVNGQRELVVNTTATVRTFENVPQGDFNYVVTSVSSRFGESVEGAEIATKIVHPVMLPPKTFTATMQNGNDVLLTWASSLYATSYNMYQIVDGQKKLLFKYNGTGRILPKMQHGTYTYVVHSVSDRFGESLEGTTATIFVDVPEIKAPSVKLDMTGPFSAKLTWGTIDYAQSYNIYRLLNGESQLIGSTTALTYNLVDLIKTENYEFVVTAAHDSYGESKNSNIVSPKFDLIPPVTEVSGGINSWYKGAAVITLAPYDIGGSGLDKTFYSVDDRAYEEGTSIFVSGEGAHTVKFYTIDKAGNIETVKTAEVKIDQTKPTVTDNYAEGITNLVLTATDDFSGIKNVYYVINGEEFGAGTEIAITPNMRTLMYFAMDNAGNRTDDVILKLNPDETAPVTVSDISEEWTAQDVNVTLTATDDLSGVASTIYTIGQQKNQQGTTFTVTDEGETNVRYFSTDNAGNTERPNVKTIKIDKTAPVTNANVTEGFWYKGDHRVVLSVQEEHSGLKALYYSLDGAAYVEGKSFGDLAEGEHTVTFYAEDNVGHKEAPQTITFMVDTQAPVTEHTVVQSGATQVINLTATDNLSGVAKTYYSTDGVSFTEGNSLILDGTQPSAAVTYYSVDVAGNMEEPKTHKIISDILPPVTLSNVPEKWVKNDFAVALTATDDLSGVAKTTYAVDESAFQEGNEFIVSEEGTHKVEFFSVDNVGNVEVKQEAELKLDKTAPVTVSNLTDGLVTKAATVELSATDNLSGLKKTTFLVNGEQVNGTSFEINAVGKYTVEYWSEDQAGNIEDKHVINVLIDNSAPTTVSNVQDVWSKTDVFGTLTATDDLSGVDKTFYSIGGTDFQDGTEFSFTEEGRHKVSFYSVDKAGNVEAVQTQDVLIDKTAPVTTSDLKDGYVNPNTVYTLAATDNLSGVKKTFFTVNGEAGEGDTLQIGGAGEYVIEYYSVDNAGNVEKPHKFTLYVDNKPPVTVSDASADWTNQDITVTLTATDDQSGVDKTYYAVDGGEFVEGTTIAITEPGIHNIIFYSVDKAGNVEAKQTAEVKLDKQAPVTTADAPQGWVNQDVAVTLTATDDLSGVKKTYYSVNGAEFVAGTDISIHESGLHKVTYYSVDNAGNVEEKKTIEVLIDEQAPVTAADAPQGWQNADVTVTLTATDDLSGVDKTFYSVDGGEFVEGTTVSITEPGTHKVTFYSVDKAGNIEAKKTIEVPIDELPPVTTSDIQDIWTNQDVPVTLTATDDLSGVKTTYYSVDGAAEQEGTSFTVTGEGIHTVTFYSVDNAGNIEQANTAEVKIDKTAPTVTLAPLKSEYVMGDKLTLSYTATDNLSGIASSVMTINGKEVANGTTLTLQPGEYTVQVTATDNAGNKTTTTVQQKFVVAILAEMEVTPMVINPNPGIFTVRLTMPKGYKYNFDIPTVSVNGAKVRGNGNPEGQAASGMFKFERMDVEKWIMPETTLVFRGYTKDGYLVIAKKTVKVNDADGGKGNTKGNGKGK